MFGAILMEDKAPGFEGSNTCSSVRIYMYVCMHSCYLTENPFTGRHVVTWVFHKERQYSWMDEDDVQTTADGGEDRVQITSIIVSGVHAGQGGAPQCLKCPSGYIANAKSYLCDACPPGTFAQEGSGTCVKCPKGTFSSGWASTQCQRCGHGTFSSEGSSACK